MFVGVYSLRKIVDIFLAELALIGGAYLGTVRCVWVEWHVFVFQLFVGNMGV